MRPIPTEPMLDNCERCAKETRHEPDADGQYHCVACRERDIAEAKEKAQRDAAEAERQRVARESALEAKWGKRILLTVFVLAAGGATALLAAGDDLGCATSSGGTSSGYSDCVDRGERYFKEQDMWPTLHSGKDAADEVRTRCSRTTGAFGPW